MTMVGPAWTADVLYGVPPTPQPNAVPVATHAPGTPEPTMRTQANQAHKGMLGDPILVLVGLIGLAFVVAHLSVRGSLSLAVS